MNKPQLAAALLLTLALLAHLFVGTRETRGLIPTEPQCRPHGLQALAVWQLVTVDLLLLTIAAYLLAVSEVFGSARRSVALFMAGYLATWTLAWLLQLRLAGARGKNYLLLGQWLLFMACAALLLWGAL